MTLLKGDLDDLCCPYFSAEVVVKLTTRVGRHLLTLIGVDMHLIQRISGQIYLSCGNKSSNNTCFIKLVTLDSILGILCQQDV